MFIEANGVTQIFNCYFMNMFAAFHCFIFFYFFIYNYKMMTELSHSKHVKPPMHVLDNKNKR